MNKHKELLIRVYIMALVVIVVAGILSYKAFKIGILEGEHWSQVGDSLYLKYFPIEAERGDVLSYDGKLLASAVPLFELRMDTRAAGLTEEAFKNGIDSLAYCLSRYANNGWSGSRYRNHLIQRRAKGDRYLLIKRQVNYAELERFKSFPIFRRGKNGGGLIVVKKSRRVRPYGDLAARTVGSVRPNVQPVGLEGYFDDVMRGVEGKRLMQKVRNGWIPLDQSDLVVAERGADIVTTIDVRVQDIAEGALLKAMERHQADWGTVVVMEVQSGEIRAIANLDRSKDGSYYEAYNNAVGKSVEPGSTMKLAAVMAMLEDGFADLNKRVNLQGGRKNFYGRIMLDSEMHGLQEVDMREAFEISSNVGIGSLADLTYGRTRKGEQFIKRLNQFGLNRTTGIQIPGEPAPYIKEAYNHDQNWSAMSIPWMAHGYELQMTPLQVLTFYNSVANNGEMVSPRLVTEVIREGETLERYERRVAIAEVASPGTIAKARELLEGVMIRGTGKKYQSEYVTMAGKTGTAVIDYFRSDGGRKKYQGSFAGYFPADQPQYSCIVMVNNPRRNGYYGGSVALPAFREIAERTMALKSSATLALSTDSLPPVTLSIQKAHSNDVEEIAKFLGLTYEGVADVEWLSIDPDQPMPQAKNMEPGKVPDLRGMGLRDAVYLLENAGFMVKARGVGKVRSQSIRAGSKVSKGAQIEIVLG